MQKSALKISLYGVDHGSKMEYDINSFQKTHLCLVEFPLVQAGDASSFSLLNDKTADYLAPELSLIVQMIISEFGIRITESSTIQSMI